MKDHASRIVPAPITSDPRLRSTILDIVCGPNEDVEWHWTMTDRGPVVSGYSIVRPPSKLSEFCASTDDASATSGHKTRPRNRTVRRQNR